MGEAVEAITIPTLFNASDVASKFGIDFEALPRTYILNADHEILSSGLHGKELESRLKSLAAER
jgi:hypothetical protein